MKGQNTMNEWAHSNPYHFSLLPSLLLMAWAFAMSGVFTGSIKCSIAACVGLACLATAAGAFYLGVFDPAPVAPVMIANVTSN
ncbi:hypothetical protein Brsp07_04518 [Brucella sp. NBRC 14130]|uniref:hypothetical protein n=1 Tax=Brucella sp. NBRC 14130 TaxID=3075483 RepID=UPI00309E4D8B